MEGHDQIRFWKDFSPCPRSSSSHTLRDSTEQSQEGAWVPLCCHLSPLLSCPPPTGSELVPPPLSVLASRSVRRNSYCFKPPVCGTSSGWPHRTNMIPLTGNQQKEQILASHSVPPHGLGLSCTLCPSSACGQVLTSPRAQLTRHPLRAHRPGPGPGRRMLIPPPQHLLASDTIIFAPHCVLFML